MVCLWVTLAVVEMKLTCMMFIPLVFVLFKFIPLFHFGDYCFSWCCHVKSEFKKTLFNVNFSSSLYMLCSANHQLFLFWFMMKICMTYKCDLHELIELTYKHVIEPTLTWNFSMSILVLVCLCCAQPELFICYLYFYLWWNMTYIHLFNWHKKHVPHLL